MNTSPGTVTLVGAGPGDPRLLTLAAVEALRAADVVLYDALLDPAVLRHCGPGAELTGVGKRAGAHSASQDSINQLLVEHARAGRNVVRLKGGDPFVFGRGGEEALACKAAGIPVRVIPGVTSAVAVPAYAGIPVTHRGLASSFAVITGASAGPESHDWAALSGIDTLVVLMGAASLGEIATSLIAAGKPPNTPACAIANGTLSSQQSVGAPLHRIAGAAASLPTPLLTVIGPVAALADQLAWREAAPLAGRRVVVTRTRTQASELRALLQALGAEVVEAPVLEIRHAAEGLTTDERVSSRWDWIVFASQNGVDAFFEALRAAGRDARALADTKLAVIGSATGEALLRHGLLADFAPSLANAATLASELPGVSGARVLLPLGSLSEPQLAQGLRQRGAHVEEATVYQTVPVALRPEAAAAVLSADAVTFASASSATFLRRALGEADLPASTKLCAIGPRAAESVRASFGRVDAVAETPSLEQLVQTVLEALT
jgi:uroporphyrinogen III methyltransferase/synthase